MVIRERKIGEWSGRRGAWRSWFAWYPVTLGQHGGTAWLRRVRRRRVTAWDSDIAFFKSWFWEYRG